MMEIPLNPILMMKKDHVFPLYQYYKEMAYVPVLPLAPAMSITRSYFFAIHRSILGYWEAETMQQTRFLSRIYNRFMKN